MAGLLVVSVPLGVNRSFDRLREDAMDSYYYDGTGYAIYQGIDMREDAANNLLTVAKRYVEKNPGLDPYIGDLEYRVKYLENLYDFQGFEQEVEANRLLGEAAQALYEQLETVELSEKDEKYPRQLIAEIESEQDKIERSSYNDSAREFNEKLAQSPTKPLTKLMGISPMGVFEKAED